MLKIHLTRNDIKKYNTSPLDLVVPEFIGQYCITDDNKVYFAKGLTSQDWILATNMNKEIDELTRRIEVLESFVGVDKPDVNIPVKYPTMVSGTTYTLVQNTEYNSSFDSYFDQYSTITMTIPTLPSLVEQVKGASFEFSVSTDDGYADVYTDTRVVRDGTTVYTIHNGQVEGVTYDSLHNYDINYPLQAGDQIVCTFGTRETLSGTGTQVSALETKAPLRGTYIQFGDFAVKYNIQEMEKI